MTEKINELGRATAALQNKTHGAGYRKGTAAVVNLTEEFMLRGIDVHNRQQKEN